ncbi:L-erythrulose 1-phosphate isomerase [Microlunatus spumicola]|uniref:Triosephosphate isomerase n=1 Tax=Microlunatus spumicola TaxID=81499 RepID=A0ABP6YAB4_9ACTN
MNASSTRTADGVADPSTRSAPTEPRPVWLGTSWKMTKTLAEARAYVEGLGPATVPDGVVAFLLPPLTALHVVRATLPQGSPVLVGVQNAHWAPDGAVTGEVSMHQVRDAGAQVVEIGHSERRDGLGETDETVAAKVAAALDQQLVPLVCVGEPWSVRSEGRAEEHVADQVRRALAHVAPEDLSRVVVAYEPVWAIGAGGRAATPGDVVGVLGRIHATVAALAPGARLRGLLYGGSVSTGNADDLLALGELDGLFVGRAAWTADGFTALLASAGRAAAERRHLSPTPAQRSR